MNKQPIGVLDSGVGGLTVLREIHTLLPYESTVYIGDSQNAPYGKRSPKEIQELAKRLIQFLLSHDAKIIVIACNTITVNGIEELRQAFPNIPIIGTVPVVKLAAKMSKKKKIGLLVTEATAKSEYNARLIQEFASNCAITIVGTNKLVPLIESENHHLLPKVIAGELQIFKKKEVDTIILGSTHFPILRKQIGEFMGQDVLLLDSGGAVARQVGRILENNGIKSPIVQAAHKTFTTGDVGPFTQVAEMVLGKGFPVAKVTL